MKTAYVAAFAFLTMASACDPGSGDFEHDEDDAEDVWSRELVVGNFELSLVEVYTSSDCTTTRTHTATGNGEYSSGSLIVGIPDADGNEVIGAITLGGDLERTEENSPADCWGTDASVQMSGVPGGVLSLRAPRAGDPMTLELADPEAYTIEEVVLDTMIFAADALHDDGTAETLRLNRFVPIANDGDSGRDVEVHVDLAVDIVVEE